MENVVTELGRPYNHYDYPHFGAPGGPDDAFDDHRVREIVLQMGSRLGKTFFGQRTTIYNGCQLRLQQIFGSTKEELASQVVKRTYKMIREVPKFNRKLVKPERLQGQHLIEFEGCNVFVGWSRSAATFADKDVYRGHANEVDDWQHLTTSKDGDPLDQLLERAKNHWSERKFTIESIPKIKGKSRVEARRLKGWNCEYYVPCPHCQRKQVLEFGGPDTTYGVKFAREDGELKAWYKCRYCEDRIENHHRAWMMRRGAWVPHGCEVVDDETPDSTSKDYKWEGWSKAPWVKGMPTKNNEIASYRLASLAALAVNWNDIAEVWFQASGRAQKIRNVVNQWFADTWEIRKTRSEPDELRKRIATDYRRGEVPEWAETITIGVDRQRADGGFVVAVVVAHNSDGRSHILDWGIFPDLATVRTKLILRAWHKPGGSGSLYAVVTAVDSGWNATETYRFCLEHDDIIAVKGGSNQTGETYGWTDLKQSKHETQDLSLLMVNTEVTESDLQVRLDEKKADDPGALTICADAAKDDDFIEQLTNAVLTDKLDQKGESKLLWIKKEEHQPNDIRDALRYAIAVYEAWEDSEHEAGSGDGRVNVQSRPDGRAWTD
jgi:phage terminase large subunit GpA-like protein